MHAPRVRSGPSGASISGRRVGADSFSHRMYAVIQTGGKQYRVAEGDRLQVERLGEAGTEVELTPVMLVDGSTTVSKRSELVGAKVAARVVEEVRGPKIVGFTYKNKSNQRKRWGHRQNLAVIEITSISKG